MGVSLSGAARGKRRGQHNIEEEERERDELLGLLRLVAEGVEAGRGAVGEGSVGVTLGDLLQREDKGKKGRRVS